MPLNSSVLLMDTARKRGDRVGVVAGSASRTFAEIADGSGRVATLLRTAGVGPGDAVAVLLPNTFEFVDCYFGVLRAGAVVVPLGTLLKRREIVHQLRNCGARALIVWDELRGEAEAAARDANLEMIFVAGTSAFDAALAACEPLAESYVDRAADDTALILYTSGTTGDPKGACLTHSNLTWSTHIVVEDILRLNGDDVIYGALPLAHVFGQIAILAAGVHAGARIVLVRRFDAQEALQLMRDGEITVFEGVPAMGIALLQAQRESGAPAPRLRVAYLGGQAIPVEVKREFETTFGCCVVEGYGLTETSAAVCVTPFGEAVPAGSVGRPIWGIEVGVVDDHDLPCAVGDVGEIVVRGHNVMAGYHARPDATADTIRGGWFHTGDMGRADDDGNFYIVDRKKDIIIRGGYNVFPREVEEVLYEHPGVLEACVIGVPHPELGEEVAAAVALRPGATATAEELKTHVKERLAAYKYPRIVALFETLPKGPTGKLLKRELDPGEVVARATTQAGGSAALRGDRPNGQGEAAAIA